jgi:hypothetical protein
MTPRALPAKATGLRGPGQTIFPEEAKEEARRIGLKPEAALVFVKAQEDDGGGDTRNSWTPQPMRVRGRIDALRSRSTSTLSGEAVDESTTHIITLDKGTVVSAKDHVEIEGQMWAITAEMFFTDEATVRLQVKELTP